jgi:nucleoside-diphosphate-sugar epimerase
MTGASGFLGRHCLPALLARGYEVHAAGRRGGGDASSGARWHEVDLLDAERVAKLVEEVAPTDLLHLAWYAVPGKFWTASENLSWVRASLNLLEEFARRGGRRVVMAGTCAEYDWTDGLCDESRTPLRPATLYGASKRALQLVVEAYARQTGLSAAWGRLFFLYGPHEYPERLVSSAICRLLKGERVPCTHGTQRRDFLYIQDAAEAFVALLASEVEGAVNIASGEALELREVVNKIADRLGGRSLVDFGALEAAAGEPPLLLAEVGRLRGEVGWRPRFTLDEGLERTIEWWRGRV